MPISFPSHYYYCYIFGRLKKITPLPYQFKALPSVELVGGGVERKVLAQHRSKSY